MTGKPRNQPQRHLELFHWQPALGLTRQVSLQMVRERFSGSEGQEKVEQVLQGHHPHLQYGWASPEMAEDRQRDSCGPRPDRWLCGPTACGAQVCMW